MRRVLFICGRNRWRSPTAEQVFAEVSGVETASAGLSNDAGTPVTPELLHWADLIFVMEKTHEAKLQRQFRKHLAGKRVVCLNIPDNYRFMDRLVIATGSVVANGHRFRNGRDGNPVCLSGGMSSPVTRRSVPWSTSRL